LTDMKRRSFLRTSVASGILVAAAGAGLLKPTRVLAAAWPAKAFGAKSVDDALKGLYGTTARTKSDDIKITANIQAENGASVPVAVRVSLPNVTALGIYVHENAQPLAANISITGGAAYLRSNIKMLKTSKVEFVAQAGGKLYTKSVNIKVTAGGCGG
jgi:sulfur-oxidizing protein SoxY